MDYSQVFEPNYILDVEAKKAKLWVIVGAGGNGGYLIPNLLRQVSLQNKILNISGLVKKLHKVIILDGDIVESSNLTRQNFLSKDIGNNKAEVMANRYGNAFGVDAMYIPEYVTSLEFLESHTTLTNERMPIVFVDCVDNNKTRAIIHTLHKKTVDSYSVSVGNEQWAGQCVIGYNAGGKKPEEGRRTPHKFDIPSICDIYPEVLNGEDKLPTELSCAEQTVSHPQNIYTNMLAANLVMGYCNTILAANNDLNEGISSHMTIFDSQIPTISTRLNKMIYLVKETEEEIGVQTELLLEEAPPLKKKVVSTPKSIEVSIEATKKTVSS